MRGGGGRPQSGWSDGVRESFSGAWVTEEIPKQISVGHFDPAFIREATPIRPILHPSMESRTEVGKRD